MADVTIAVTYFSLLLGLGVLIANILKKYNLPDVFFLLLLGLVLGPTVFANPAVTQYLNITLVDVGQMGNIPDFLRILALILVVFTGTFNINMKTFKKYSGVSIRLALFGVIFNMLFLGFFAYLIFGFDLVFALLLGAILGGTGDAAVFAFKKVLSKSRGAFNVMSLESILNSPVSVVLPILILDIIALQAGGEIEPLKYMNQFWLNVAAGAGTGIIIGYGISKLMGKMLKEYSVLLMLSIALVTFALAESVGGSGILAVAVCGLITGNMAFKHREDVRRFDDYFYEMLRISVFTLLGAMVSFSMDLAQLQAALLFFGLMTLARPLFVIPTLGSIRYDISRRDLLILCFVGPKGIETAAMAPIVAAAMTGLGNQAAATQILNITVLMILLSSLFSTIAGKALSSDRFFRDRPGKRRRFGEDGDGGRGKGAASADPAGPGPELEAEQPADGDAGTDARGS
jgi:cell volume regulation protein A